MFLSAYGQSRGADLRVAVAEPPPQAGGMWLSDKEIAVLRELALGRQTDEIAEVLYLSPHTVRSHVKNGMKKLGARNRAHAVAIALSAGAIEYEPERDAGRRAPAPVG
jgi:DNA-binding CsgD family transcriptional regulator